MFEEREMKLEAISSFLVLKKKNKASKRSLLTHEDVVFSPKMVWVKGL
jgi:hypothetical protein